MRSGLRKRTNQKAYHDWDSDEGDDNYIPEQLRNQQPQAPQRQTKRVKRDDDESYDGEKNQKPQAKVEGQP